MLRNLTNEEMKNIRNKNKLSNALFFYKMFCSGPVILSQPKNFTALSASSKTFELAQKT